MCVLGMRSYFFHKLLDRVTADARRWALSSACKKCDGAELHIGSLTVSWRGRTPPPGCSAAFGAAETRREESCGVEARNSFGAAISDATYVEKAGRGACSLLPGHPDVVLTNKVVFGSAGTSEIKLQW